MLAETGFPGDWLDVPPSAGDAGGWSPRDQLGDAVIGAAILVSTAFRLRDDPGLTSALRLLTRSVDDWEVGAIEAASGSP